MIFFRETASTMLATVFDDGGGLIAFPSYAELVDHDTAADHPGG